MLVVDASAVVDLLLRRPIAAQIESMLEDHGYELHAPHLLDLEVLSALWRLVAAGEATTARAEQAIAAHLDLPIARYAHEVLVGRIWELRDSLSACDACYLALAEKLTDGGAPLLTADARFASAARAHTAVEVVLVA